MNEKTKMATSSVTYIFIVLMNVFMNVCMDSNDGHRCFESNPKYIDIPYSFLAGFKVNPWHNYASSCQLYCR